MPEFKCSDSCARKRVSLDEGKRSLVRALAAPSHLDCYRGKLLGTSFQISHDLAAMQLHDDSSSETTP